MGLVRPIRGPAVAALAVVLLAAAAASAQPPGQLPQADPAPPMPAADPAGPGATAPADPAPPDAPPPAKPKWDFRWGNPGLFVESADKDFTAHVGGALHYDSAWYQADERLEFGPGGTGRFVDGTNLRRARIILEGTVYRVVDYKFEVEFANGFIARSTGTAGGVIDVTNSPGPLDMWVTVKDVPVLGNVRVGNQKEWFSLEVLNSARALEFLERSYLTDLSQASAFNNNRSPGVSAFRTWADDRVFTGAGVYKNISDQIGAGLGFGQYAVTGRVAALPVWEPDDQLFVMVGGAMSHRDPVNGAVQVRVREQVRNAPPPLLNLLVNTGQIPTGSQQLYNLQTAGVAGPLTFQAEYEANVLSGAVVERLGGIVIPIGNLGAVPPSVAGPRPGETLVFQGFYAHALWLVTGESRTFNTKTYVLNRVVPKRPVRFKPRDGEERGWGAWEVGVRYSYLDVTNKDLRAGRLDAVTVGLNWYLNAAAKLQFNYDVAHRGDTASPAEGTVHAFGTRLAFDF